MWFYRIRTEPPHPRPWRVLIIFNRCHLILGEYLNHAHLQLKHPKKGQSKSWTTLDFFLVSCDLHTEFQSVYDRDSSGNLGTEVLPSQIV